MRTNTLLTKVPYELPRQEARDVAPSLVGTKAIKVYQLSPMFWAVAPAGAGRFRVQMGTVFGAGHDGYEVTPSAAAEFISHTSHPVQLLAQIRQLGWLDLAAELEKAVAARLQKTERSGATGFATQFTEICQRYGGVFNAADTIGDGLCYHVSTSVGLLKVSIQADRPEHRRYRSKIASIYLQFKNYTGLTPFPYHGDFNTFSHKWNILCSADTMAAARREALLELDWRLELVCGKGPERSVD